MLNWINSLLQQPDIEGYLDRDALILDVRTSGEFQQGHAPGARNIPLQDMGRRSAEIKGWQKPIITCCRSGNRSGLAASQLRKAGIDAINGGSWQNVARYCSQS